MIHSQTGHFSNRFSLKILILPIQRNLHCI